MTKYQCILARLECQEHKHSLQAFRQEEINLPTKAIGGTEQSITPTSISVISNQ